MKVEWKTTSTRMKTGMALNEKTGKKEAVKHEVSYEYPVITGCDTENDIAAALAEIRTANKSGFQTMPHLQDRINHGLYRHYAVMLNSGQNPAYTQTQLLAIKNMAEVVRKTPPELQAQQIALLAPSLQMLGIQDAERWLTPTPDPLLTPQEATETAEAAD